MSILGVPPNRMVKLDRSDLDHFGKMLIRFILEEIKKDAMLSTNIPDTRDFYDSFGYKIDGNNVVITSSWPWIDLLIEGTNGPYPMKWLTAAEGTPKIPLRSKDGTMVVRSTPLTTDKAWIHPGIAKHTFIQRAFDRAKGEFARRVLDKNMSRILKGAFGGR